MDTHIYLVAFENHVLDPTFYETTIWAHKNECMHCNTILSLHEPIHSFPLHLHVHLTLEEEPLEAQDLGLELSLQKIKQNKLTYLT
jgi:hypothetical protein